MVIITGGLKGTVGGSKGIKGESKGSKRDKGIKRGSYPRDQRVDQTGIERGS